MCVFVSFSFECKPVGAGSRQSNYCRSQQPHAELFRQYKQCEVARAGACQHESNACHDEMSWASFDSAAPNTSCVCALSFHSPWSASSRQVIDTEAAFCWREGHSPRPVEYIPPPPPEHHFIRPPRPPPTSQPPNPQPTTLDHPPHPPL